MTTYFLDDLIIPKLSVGNSQRVRVVKKYAFSSSLKRMSCVVQPEMPASFYKSDSSVQAPQPRDQALIVTKGAPEILREMFSSLPTNYDALYKHYAMRGSRVLAFGWKWKQIHPANLRDLPRSAAEEGLNFGGFLVFTSPLKPDTAVAIKELQDSMHRVCLQWTPASTDYI